MMGKYINEFGENFSLAIYWNQGEHFFSYYSIPYPFIKNVLTMDNSERKEGKRWIMTINHNHILHLNGTTVNIDVAKYLHALSEEDFFEYTIPIKSAPEGMKKKLLHCTFERDAYFVRKIKDTYRRKNPDMPCQICGFSFTDIYGENYIEAHHKVPLAELKESQQHDENDFEFVCANCHRMLHRIPNITSDKLRDLFQKYSKN